MSDRNQTSQVLTERVNLSWEQIQAAASAGRQPAEAPGAGDAPQQPAAAEQGGERSVMTLEDLVERLLPSITAHLRPEIDAIVKKAFSEALSGMDSQIEAAMRKSIQAATREMMSGR